MEGRAGKWCNRLLDIPIACACETELNSERHGKYSVQTKRKCHCLCASYCMCMITITLYQNECIFHYYFLSRFIAIVSQVSAHNIMLPHFKGSIQQFLYTNVWRLIYQGKYPCRPKLRSEHLNSPPPTKLQILEARHSKSI